MKEEGERYSHSSHITAETRAESQETSEQSDDGKEKSNDEEGEHETGKVVVVVRANVTVGSVIGRCFAPRSRRTYPRNPAGMLVVVPKF